MRNHRSLLCVKILSLFSAFFLTSCDFITPSMKINYKVTVEIETPEGIKTGYAVRQIYNRTPLVRFPDVGNPASIRGEAVVVDLGERGKVFFTLSDQSRKNGLYQAFPTKAPSSKDGVQYYIKTLKPGMKAEWSKFKPKFVMFRDITDPKSITLLRNEERWNDDLRQVTADDHFEAILGQGVQLKIITVEITDEPVTWGVVEENLPKKRPISGMQRFKKGKQK